MKKTALLLVLAMTALLAFAGCGSDNKSDTQEQTTAVTSTTAKATEAPKGAVDASWFDDAVFVGDSVTLKLSYYCADHEEALGNAQFFCAGSLGFTNALWDLDDPRAVHPYYKGENQLAENCAVLTGASKVFIMLGMNDMALYGVDDTMESAKTLIGKIKANSPDATIYIQSVTPIIEGKESGTFSNETVHSMDNALKAYCEQEGIKYLDLCSELEDENGYLPLEYCGDIDAMGIHFSDVACQKWADFLKENVNS